MNREQVIELAQKADIPFNKYGLIGCSRCEQDIDDALIRFAVLVSEAEQAKVRELVAVLEKAEKMLVSQENSLRALGADEPNAEPAILSARAAIAKHGVQHD